MVTKKNLTVSFVLLNKEITMGNFTRDRQRSGFRRDFGPREMHKAKCTECGKECEVPFKPTEGRPVFCRECFAKKRQF